jgi:type III secretory pathway component EscS
VRDFAIFAHMSAPHIWKLCPIEFNKEKIMEELTVTWTKAIRIWWSWFWRSMAYTLPVAFLFGFIVGISGQATNIDATTMAFITQLSGGLIGVFFAIFALKRVLAKSFNGYRIALVKTTDVSTSTVEA